MKNKEIMKMAVIFIGVIFMFGTYSFAAPPIWETDYGDVLDDLTTQDDEETEVTISFPFPFNGVNYTVVYVGTNGGLQLGGLGDDGDIDYDFWSYMEDFLNDSAPIICPFDTDLDLESNGTIHFNDFGDRAVFTWNEVGTYENNAALNTFQVQLYDDGTIVFGYNGILDGPEEDLLEDLGEGIVVGITPSDLPPCEDPGTFDLNGGPFSAGTTIHQRWCYDMADTCECNEDSPWTGPINTAFDLDQQNVVFSPEGTGYRVSAGLMVVSGNATITNVRIPAIPAGAPANFTAETAVSFTATGVTDTADISITFFSLPANPFIYKVVNGIWKQIYPINQTSGITNVTLTGNTLSYTIEDDSDCDSNPTTGTIEDPVVAGTIAGASGVDSLCFIATAAYGSSMEPHVKILCKFRDRFLLTNGLGKAFVKYYYTYSPALADFTARHDGLRAVVRIALLPLIGASWVVINLGPVYSLALMLLLCSVLIGFVGFRRKFKK